MPYKTLTFSDFGINKTATTLKNGLRVVIFERKGSPLALRLCFLAGARFDPLGKEGLSHFTEHLIISGTKSYPSKDKLAMSIEELGGTISAFTSSEVLGVEIELGDASDLEHACEVLNEMINASLVLPKMVESERGATLSELERRESNPEKMIGVLAKMLLYQGTDMGHPTIGTRESIAKISREDVVSYIKNLLTSGRALLAISGEIEPTEAIKVIENSLNIPFSETLLPFEKLPILRNKSISVKNYPSGQVFLDLGFRTCSYFDKDELALGGLASIIGGGRASRLVKKLRYERGLVYGARCYSSCGYDSGEWGVETSTDKKNLPEVLKIIAEVIDEAREGKITSDELDFAKARTIKSSKLSTQTSMSWIRKHAYGELTGPNQYLNFPDFLNEISKISLDDIHQVAKKYLRNDSLYLTLCGPASEEEVKFEL